MRHDAHSEADFRIHCKFIIYLPDALETFFKRDLRLFQKHPHFPNIGQSNRMYYTKNGTGQAAKHLENLGKNIKAKPLKFHQKRPSSRIKGKTKRYD